jgi:hypothetical protein
MNSNDKTTHLTIMVTPVAGRPRAYAAHWPMKSAAWQSFDAACDSEVASALFSPDMKFPPLGPTRSRP